MSIHKEAAELDLRNKIVYRKLATPDSLCVRPLDLDEIKKMHSLTYRWHEQNNNENLTNAIEKPHRIQEGVTVAATARAKKFWKNPNADIEHVDEYRKAGDDFADFHPAFMQIRSNLQEMGLELAKQNLNPTLENLNEVYRDLVLAGRLTLAIENMPNAPVDAPAEATGIVLQRWIQLMPSLLDPVVGKSESEVEAERIAGLSSSEYQEQFMQKEDTLPPLIQVRIERDIKGFCGKHPEYDPTPEGRAILLDYIRERGIPINHDSLELSYAANKKKLHEVGSIFDEGPSIPVRYNASTLIDHRKPFIPPVAREVTLEPAPTVKRVDMEKLLALPADEFQRVVNGTPGLRELLDGE